jgi:hypothetical protein
LLLMDARFSAEQRELRHAAARLAADLGPGSVADLGEAQRAARLDAAVNAAGWRELRAPSGDANSGQPLATAVDAALVAEELAHGLADTTFLGATLAAELRRLAGAAPARSLETVALTPELTSLATAPGLGATAARTAVAIDSARCASALLLVPGPDGAGLATVALAAGRPGPDLTRPLASATTADAEPVPASRTLTAALLDQWSAFTIAMTCADLVGTMRGAVRVGCEYAKIRRQYGAPVGTFQAVQHALASAHVAAEGSASVALYAAWAADALPPGEARLAAAVAKAYCSRAARSVCETVIQVHGGIGNTWECTAHLYLRRALLSARILGGAGPSLAYVLANYQIGEGTPDGVR